MSFDELMDKVWALSGLPRIAREQLPRSLSDTTKKNLIRRSPEEIVQIFQKAIDEVNGGATDSIDVLVNETLRGNYSR